MSRRAQFIAGVSIVFLLLIVAAACWPRYLQERKTGWVGSPGPAQPVDFKHEVHVNELHIPCSYCHWTAATSRVANIPPEDVCWGCHKDISITHPEIEKLRHYYLTGTPIPWVRINEEPEYVHFSHAAHVGADISCSTCHGDVGRMQAVYQPVEMNMEWCVTCHEQHESKFRPRQAAKDCATCHY